MNTLDGGKHIRTLELDKILDMLCEYTASGDAADAVRGILPMTDPSLVKTELSMTDAAFTLSAKFGSPVFSRISNPEVNLGRCQVGATLNCGELLGIAEVLRQTKSLKQWHRQCENADTPLLGFFSSLNQCSALLSEITDAIISQDEIADNASAELYSIRRKIRTAQDRVRQILEKITRSSTLQKYLMEPIITMRNGRFVVPVKSESRQHIQGLVHDTSSSGATLFVEPMSVVEANNEIKLLQESELREIDRILSSLSASCAEYADDIRTDFEIIKTLNIYFAKAALGAEMNAVVPAISDNRVIKLKKARHPLISKDYVVPIDIDLGENYKSLIITGPNTGGKTVSLKTLGLLTLMAACGLMIPAGAGSVVSVFDNVLADIGDEQSIEQNLSTFSSHITNIIRILEVAGGNSLVLLDELGSGTDPAEGAALAIALIGRLRDKGCLLAATTHYSELKIYALNTPDTENGCCEFDIDTLRPTYKLLIGIPGRSNAFAISERLGMDGGILEKAKSLLTGEDKQFDDVVDRLERSRLEYEKKSETLNKNNQEIEQLKKEITVIKGSIEKDRDRQLKQAAEQAKKVVTTAKEQAEALIEELDSIRKQKDHGDFSSLAAAAKTQLKGKLERLSDTADPVVPKKDDNYKLPRPLKIGDGVIVSDIDKKGTVISISGKTVTVQAGIMKMRINEDNLRLDLGGEKPVFKTGSINRTIKSNTQRDSSSELNLRGMMTDEAIMVLDSFIDNCVMGNIKTLTIIHGKGTGALRKAVTAHLRGHSSVKSHRLGTFGEGESGVTIAELK
ncbi:MAG: endonuclease MutS2 [Oscillospiraceae bacterium]|nr:endonuclease MutS2 [Oscillospiraceae bacterium]